MKEGPSRVVFGHHPMAGRKSLRLLHIYSLLAVIRTRIFFRLKVSHCCNSRVLDLCPTTNIETASQNPTCLIKHSSLFASPDCISLFLLVLRLLAGIDLCGQVDLALVWSITSGVGVAIAKARRLARS